MCDALGIDWKSQHVKIKADPVLSICVVEITTQLPSTSQSRAYTMLPIEFLSGWLFTIKKVRPEVQDKLSIFRAEGFDVALDAWFRKGLRNTSTVADMLANPDFAIELLTKFKEEQAEPRRAAVETEVLMRGCGGNHHNFYWLRRWNGEAVCERAGAPENTRGEDRL